MYKALIIDDEPSARRLIRHLLQSHTSIISIAGEAGNGAEAIQQINHLKPDLVFLDIQLSDQTGFDVLNQLSFRPNVIFTTAYEQYAIQAFEAFSIDYLLKPIRQERLDAAIQKFIDFGKRPGFPDPVKIQDMIGSLKTSRRPSAFPLKTGDRILLIRFDQISHFEADDKYVFLFTVDGLKYLTDQTLGGLEAILPGEFLRVQKSYVINKDLVHQIRKHFNGRYIIQLNDRKQTQIRTGFTYYEKIRESFGL